MIQDFQKFSQSRIAKIFLAVVALSFLTFFGGGGWFRPHDPNAIVAEVGNLSIGREELARKVQQYAQQVAAKSGQTPTLEQLLAMGLPQMILEGLVQDLLLNLEAKHLGLTVSDEALSHHIHSTKAFQNEKGEFDRNHFVQLLRANGFSEDSFIAEVRQELIRNQLANAVMVGVSLPDEMVNPLFDLQYQHRQASLLQISGKEMPLPSPPSNEVLETFYKEHKQEFKTPELRTFTFLIFDPAVMGKDILVTDEEIKSTYEAKSEEFKKKSLEEAKERIVAEIQKEKALENIYKLTQELDDKIAGGATFEELAPSIKEGQLIKLVDIDKKGQDRLGVLSSHLFKNKELNQEILKAAFELDEGSDSPFTQAREGAYFTIRVDKVTPAAFQPFEEIKDRILKKWSEGEQFKSAYSKAKEYVSNFNKGSRKISLMTLLPNISLSEPSPTLSEEVKSLIYSLQVGQAGMTRTPDGFAVIVLNKIIPPDVKIRDEKMDAFKDILLKNYKNDFLLGYVNALHIRYPVKYYNTALKSLYMP